MEIPRHFCKHLVFDGGTPVPKPRLEYRPPYLIELYENTLQKTARMKIGPTRSPSPGTALFSSLKPESQPGARLSGGHDEVSHGDSGDNAFTGIKEQDRDERSGYTVHIFKLGCLIRRTNYGATYRASQFSGDSTRSLEARSYIFEGIPPKVLRYRLRNRERLIRREVASGVLLGHHVVIYHVDDDGDCYAEGKKT